MDALLDMLQGRTFWRILLFLHFVERNRFATLARNAPLSMLFDAAWVFLRDTLVIFRRDVVRPVARRGRPSPRLVVRRLRAFAAFVEMLPTTLASRRRQRVSRSRRDELVRRWAVPQ